MGSIIHAIKDAKEKMLRICCEPTEVRMSLENYVNLCKEVNQYQISPPFDIPTDIILDKNGEQIPIGKIYGLDIYIDNRLPHEQIIVK